jgi:hypothetical protein
MTPTETQLDIFGAEHPPADVRLATAGQRHEDYKHRQERLLRAGKHPMNGLPLRAEGGTCGDCAHLVRKKWAGTYFKCRKGDNTNGPATDVRLKWPACELWATEKQEK